MHTRDEAWDALEGGFKTLMDCLGQLTEEEITSTQVVGKWTVKNTIAHVWSWTDETAKTVRAWQDRRPWQEGVVYDDAWSERQAEDRSALALISVVDGLTGAHRRVMHLLDLADDASLPVVGKAFWGEEMPLVDFFYAAAEHYVEHIADLKAYQERCLNCD